MSLAYRVLPLLELGGEVKAVVVRGSTLFVGLARGGVTQYATGGETLNYQLEKVAEYKTPGEVEELRVFGATNTLLLLCVDGSLYSATFGGAGLSWKLLRANVQRFALHEASGSLAVWQGAKRRFSTSSTPLGVLSLLSSPANPPLREGAVSGSVAGEVQQVVFIDEVNLAVATTVGYFHVCVAGDLWRATEFCPADAATWLELMSDSTLCVLGQEGLGIFFRLAEGGVEPSNKSTMDLGVEAMRLVFTSRHLLAFTRDARCEVRARGDGRLLQEFHLPGVASAAAVAEASEADVVYVACEAYVFGLAGQSVERQARALVEQGAVSEAVELVHVSSRSPAEREQELARVHTLAGWRCLEKTADYAEGFLHLSLVEAVDIEKLLNFIEATGPAAAAVLAPAAGFLLRRRGVEVAARRRLDTLLFRVLASLEDPRMDEFLAETDLQVDVDAAAVADSAVVGRLLLRLGRVAEAWTKFSDLLAVSGGLCPGDRGQLLRSFEVSDAAGLGEHAELVVRVASASGEVEVLERVPEEKLEAVLQRADVRKTAVYVAWLRRKRRGPELIEVLVERGDWRAVVEVLQSSEFELSEEVLMTLLVRDSGAGGEMKAWTLVRLGRLREALEAVPEEAFAEKVANTKWGDAETVYLLLLAVLIANRSIDRATAIARAKLDVVPASRVVELLPDDVPLTGALLEYVESAALRLQAAENLAAVKESVTCGRFLEVHDRWSAVRSLGATVDAAETLCVVCCARIGQRAFTVLPHGGAGEGEVADLTLAHVQCAGN